MDTPPPHAADSHYYAMAEYDNGNAYMSAEAIVKKEDTDRLALEALLLSTKASTMTH